MSDLILWDMGRAAYEPVLELQKQLVEEAKNAPDDRAWLLLLEHDPPVITLGRRGKDADILLPHRTINEMGIEIYESSRGGEVTYHGPGQLVGYAIIQLKRRGRNVHGHVYNLEETIIRTLERFGIVAGRRKGFTGVWVGDEKVAAIGVAVHRWVTYHGFALNVDTDMSHFDLIVPCGITDKAVTSMSKILGRAVTVEEVKPHLAEIFCDVMGFEKREPGTRNRELGKTRNRKNGEHEL
ncbi:MAG: lipoyl(octanoyl) transferase LipB [Phycisphaerae bacterium]|nr:lipoyl(octanoyl) transferase LipB [Phycisphaerae bacterium]